MSESASMKKHPYGLRTIMEIFDIGRGVAFTVIGITAAILVMGLVFFIRSAPPTHLTIITGPEGSMFQRTALKYANALKKNGVKLDVLTSSGTLENLDRITDPKSKVDLAIIQSGIIDDNISVDNLVSLGATGNQPLLFFYHGKTIGLLSQIKGKTVAIGQQGSGTRKLALKLLDLNGIKEKDPKGTKLLDLDADDATDALMQKKIDAAFIMSENVSPESLRKLMRSEEVHLMNFKNAAAYARKIDYLNMLNLPQGVIDFGENIPSEDTALVGPTIELIAVQNLHPALSDLLLDAAMTIHGRPGLFQKRSEFPAPIEHNIRLSEDADRFYRSGKSFLYRSLPFWLASLLNRILVVFVPILIVIIPAIRSLPMIFRWRGQMRIRRLYRELLTIEEEFKSEKDKTRLAELHKNFDRIDNKIRVMRVRPFFADQFYSLRVHIDYVRQLMSSRG